MDVSERITGVTRGATVQYFAELWSSINSVTAPVNHLYTTFISLSLSLDFSYPWLHDA